MKVGVWQSNYIPWKGYFDYINDVDIFCFYDEVQYTKNDWRNRNQFLNLNGKFWVTVPIDKKYTKHKISETIIKDPKILKKHFKSIEQSYAKAPYKKQVLDLLSPIYLETEWEYLSKLNQTLIQVISNYIGITTIFKNSKDYELKDNIIDRLLSLNTQLKATTYISGPNARGYLKDNEYKFKNNNIEVKYKEYGPYLPYPRINDQFSDQVSIIDLLMHLPQDQILKHITSLK
jgi:hypothetical protein